MDLTEAKERIRRIMKREDISVDAAATAADVSTSTVRRWCNPSDNTDIGLHAFSQFAFEFDLSMDALMFPRARTTNAEERDIHREWRANMDWWDVHLSAEQKAAIMECFKAIWQVGGETTEKQLRMTDPERFRSAGES